MLSVKLTALEILSQNKSLVWPEIKKYLDRISDTYHHQLISDYPLRQGKYLRPTLVLLTAASLGFSKEKALLTAAAMQTSEDWILIHDDIEDDSPQRRGAPALHQIYGKELAINAGDGLHLLMWQMLNDNPKLIGDKLSQKVNQEIIRILERTVLGQTIELKWTRENCQQLTDEDIFFIIDGKTVYYTIAGPMRLGAILAGANQSQLQTISDFALPLGRCFQIVDDLLDLTSDFKGLKKQPGNDIQEGKRTIMLMHLLHSVKNKDLKQLQDILNLPRENRTTREIKWVIQKMEQYGSLDYGRKLAQQFAFEAQALFDSHLQFLKHEPARTQLQTLFEFILKRDH